MMILLSLTYFLLDYSHCSLISPDDFSARIAQAALNKQKQSKRFKKQDNTNESDQTNDSKTAYMKLVSELQKAQGDKDATTGACNVR